MTHLFQAGQGHSLGAKSVWRSSLVQPHIKTEWLLAFRAVLLTGTVTEAAAQIFRTQPQVSRMIRALEEATRLRLFTREGRRLIPTDAALSFADYIQPTLKMLEGLEAFSEDVRLRRRTPLVVLAEPFLIQGLVPEVLERLAPFEDRRLGIDLCVRRVGVWQNQSDADFAMVALPFAQTDFIAKPFAEAEVVLVTPPGHPLKDHQKVSFAEIGKYPFIALRPTTLLRAQIDTLAAASGQTLRPRLETDSGSVAVDLVSRGFGLTIADPLVARSYSHTGIGIAKLETRIVIRYGFLLRDTEPSEAIEHALARVRETAKDLGRDFLRLL